MKPKYGDLYGVREVARILGAEPILIKEFSLIFANYLTANANPLKGRPRQYRPIDIPVLVYVLMYWEEDPDVESIKIGLNLAEHREYPYSEIVQQMMPLFTDHFEGIDELSARYALIEGMSHDGDLFTLACAYKKSGDRLVDSALANDDGYEIISPIIYNYRHSTELYLKALLPRYDWSHDLTKVMVQFEKLMKEKLNAEVPVWFTGVIQVFHDFDPKGTRFRYGGGEFRDEVVVDLTHLKNVMNWFDESCIKVREKLRKVN